MSKSRVINNVFAHRTVKNKHCSPLRNVLFAICHLSTILKRKSVYVKTTTSIAQFCVAVLFKSFNVHKFKLYFTLSILTHLTRQYEKKMCFFRIIKCA